ncbi:MAG: hypothetical protein GY830_10915 [Bacteroidetes bacterium]|nr:hypothetical protein [Bacteroidota bacterium]
MVTIYSNKFNLLYIINIFFISLSISCRSNNNGSERVESQNKEEVRAINKKAGENRNNKKFSFKNLFRRNKKNKNKNVNLKIKENKAGSWGFFKKIVHHAHKISHGISHVAEISHTAIAKIDALGEKYPIIKKGEEALFKKVGLPPDTLKKADSKISQIQNIASKADSIVDKVGQKLNITDGKVKDSDGKVIISTKNLKIIDVKLAHLDNRPKINISLATLAAKKAANDIQHHPFHYLETLKNLIVKYSRNSIKCFIDNNDLSNKTKIEQRKTDGSHTKIRIYVKQKENNDKQLSEYSNDIKNCLDNYLRVLTGITEQSQNHTKAQNYEKEGIMEDSSDIKKEDYIKPGTFAAAFAALDHKRPLDKNYEKLGHIKLNIPKNEKYIESEFLDLAKQLPFSGLDDLISKCKIEISKVRNLVNDYLDEAEEAKSKETQKTNIDRIDKEKDIKEHISKKEKAKKATDKNKRKNKHRKQELNYKKKLIDEKRKEKELEQKEKQLEKDLEEKEEELKQKEEELEKEERRMKMRNKIKKKKSRIVKKINTHRLINELDNQLNQIIDTAETEIEEAKKLIRPLKRKRRIDDIINDYTTEVNKKVLEYQSKDVHDLEYKNDCEEEGQEAIQKIKDLR